MRQTFVRKGCKGPSVALAVISADSDLKVLHRMIKYCYIRRTDISTSDA